MPSWLQQTQFQGQDQRQRAGETPALPKSKAPAWRPPLQIQILCLARQALP